MKPEQQSGGTILVIEDDADTRTVLIDLLEIDGYRVTAVANGLAALHYLRTAPRPGLILLDLTMPVMDGWEFRKQQQQDPLLASIPVVVVSGGEDPRQPSGLAGAVGYFLKPVHPQTLLDTIARHCQ